MLHMEGRRPMPSRDPLDFADSVLALDARILEGGADLRVPFDDRLSDCFPVRPQALRDLDYGDVADDIERTRQRSSERRRDPDDVSVTADREESLLELRLLGGETELDASSSRQSDGNSIGTHSQRFQEKALVEELAPD